MRFITPILLWLYPLFTYPQVNDSLQKKDTKSAQIPTVQKTINLKDNKPEIFTSGFIDIVNSGQINASARFIRLYVGEPGKFSLPFSLYSGCKYP